MQQRAFGYPQGAYPYGGWPGAAPVPGYPPANPSIAPAVSPSDVPGMLPIQESYIENILRLNKGKVATVYMSFSNNESEWSSKVFRGVIEAAGRDHLILSDPQTGRRYLLLMIYLDFVTFDEEINYEYPYPTAPR